MVIGVVFGTGNSAKLIHGFDKPVVFVISKVSRLIERIQSPYKIMMTVIECVTDIPKGILGGNCVILSVIDSPSGCAGNQFATDFPLGVVEIVGSAVAS